ncbi:MAG TPA: 2-oxo acid dehydrogenase subunit E2 [Methylocystis sp.]|nr:2-oxo acid dehydrogenase subunit E2 [Methylocystis sp.]
MTAAATAPDSDRMFSSPLARRLAKEKGLDLRLIKGSGPHGRIVERDVLSARQKAPAPEPSAPQQFQTLDVYEEIPLDSMRKTIARRLTEAAQTIPHFYLTCDCEIDALLRLREDINAAAPGAEQGKPEWKVSVNDFIVKALALALQQVPDANATYTPEALLRHKSSDIGVAVSVPGGLITPIIRGAEKKSLREISAEIKEKAQRAKERRLGPMEYEGGVSAVSNLGMFGVKNFTAVINPPQSTILAVGAGESRIVAKDGAPSVATMMTVTLSCDHRVVDGVLGAELLAAFKRLVERPAAMLA